MSDRQKIENALFRSGWISLVGFSLGCGPFENHEGGFPFIDADQRRVGEGVRSNANPYYVASDALSDGAVSRRILLGHADVSSWEPNYEDRKQALDDLGLHLCLLQRKHDGKWVTDDALTYEQTLLALENEEPLYGDVPAYMRDFANLAFTHGLRAVYANRTNGERISLRAPLPAREKFSAILEMEKRGDACIVRVLQAGGLQAMDVRTRNLVINRDDRWPPVHAEALSDPQVASLLSSRIQSLGKPMMKETFRFVSTAEFNWDIVLGKLIHGWERIKRSLGLN